MIDSTASHVGSSPTLLKPATLAAPMHSCVDASGNHDGATLRASTTLCKALGFRKSMLTVGAHARAVSILMWVSGGLQFTKAHR